MLSSKVFVQLYHSIVSSGSLSFFVYFFKSSQLFLHCQTFFILWFLITNCCSAFTRRACYRNRNRIQNSMLQKQTRKKPLTDKIRSEEGGRFVHIKSKICNGKKTLTNRWIKCIYTIKLLETSTRVKKNEKWNECNFCVYFVDIFIVALATTTARHIYQRAHDIPKLQSFYWLLLSPLNLYNFPATHFSFNSVGFFYSNIYVYSLVFLLLMCLVHFA